jgi:hypothetical protein
MNETVRQSWLVVLQFETQLNICPIWKCVYTHGIFLGGESEKKYEMVKLEEPATQLTIQLGIFQTAKPVRIVAN